MKSKVAQLLERFPHFRVATRMREMISIRLGLTERCAVDQHLTIDDPEDAHSRLRLQSVRLHLVFALALCH